jgi:hypothetical protein
MEGRPIMTNTRRIKLVDNPVAVGYLKEDFTTIEIDCEKLYEATQPELSFDKKKAVERYVHQCGEINKPVLVMYGSEEVRDIRFIDGRHTFVTLYENLSMRRLEVMVPETQVQMFQRAVG